MVVKTGFPQLFPERAGGLQQYSVCAAVCVTETVTVTVTV
jgi:hypothetical protein